MHIMASGVASVRGVTALLVEALLNCLQKTFEIAENEPLSLMVNIGAHILTSFSAVGVLIVTHYCKLMTQCSKLKIGRYEAY